MEIKLKVQIHAIKTTEVVHLKINDKLIMCSQRKTLNQTLSVLTKQKTTDVKLHCEKCEPTL